LEYFFEGVKFLTPGYIFSFAVEPGPRKNIINVLFERFLEKMSAIYLNQNNRDFQDLDVEQIQVLMALL